MMKIQNNTLQKFIDRFTNELKKENDWNRYHKKEELDIPFILSTLCQSFSNNVDRYKDFISDLNRWSDYGVVINKDNIYYDAIIKVDIILVKYSEDNYDYYRDYDNPNYNYQLCFTCEERNFSYCMCTPDMQDYREDKKCCGHGCDATFCTFSLHKIINIAEDRWNGDKHDYWDFEDEFYKNEKEIADKKSKEDKSRMIKELKDRIEADSKKLAELKGE